MKSRRFATLAAGGLLAAAASLPGCVNCPGVKGTAAPPAPVIRQEPVIERTPVVVSAGGPWSIEVTPASDVNPVKTQHVMVATVRDQGGNPVPGAKVEWILGRGPRAVGDIVEVDGGRKLDNTYAETVTGRGQTTLDMGNSDPSDDVMIGPGQTWCVISSPIEGTTNVVAYAPDIKDWNRHKAWAEKTWMDVTWEMPMDATNRVGSPHSFDVRVMRFSDGTPYVGWKVHYRLASGPAGSFSTGGGTATISTGADGVATVVFNQASPAVGTNEVEIMLVRPAKKDECECYPEKSFGPWIVRKHWVAPDLAIDKTGPATAMLGETFSYGITVTNLANDLEIRDAVVTDALDDGVDYVSSSPAATVSGRTLTWNLGTLGPSAVHNMTVTVKANRKGRIPNCAVVTAENGRITKKDCVETEVTAPAIKIEKFGPDVVMVCDPITYRIIVRNTGDGPASDVRVVDQLPEGMTTTTGERRVEFPTFSLAAGDSREFTLDARVSGGGNFTNTATVTTAGGLSGQASATTRVTECALTLMKKVKRADLIIGRPAVFDLTVSNRGDAEARDVVIEDMIPAGMSFVSASDGGVMTGSTVVWNVGNLAPGASRSVSLTLTSQSASSFTNTATARAYCCKEATASDGVKYSGIAAILLEVIDVYDPIEVGGQETYEIKVTNQGNADDTNIVITVNLPQQEKYISADTTKAQNVRWNVSGQQIKFEPVRALAPKDVIVYLVTVECTGVGDVRFAVQLDSDVLESPVNETESTHIY